MENEEYEVEERQDGEIRSSDFEDYDDYVKALADQAVKKATAGISPEHIRQEIAQGVREGIQPQPQEPQVTPYSDDPHRAKRLELASQSIEYSKAAILAEGQGKDKKAREWRQLQGMVERELADLPPSPEQEHMEQLAEKMDENGMGLLMNPGNAGHAFWDQERIQVDSGIVVARALGRARKIIRLPELDGPYGNPLDLRPEHMLTFELPDSAMKSFKRELEGLGASDPDTVFRQAHRIIDKLGYSSAGKRVVESKGEETSAEGDRNKMTFKQYTAWREKAEEKRRIPILPKPR